MCIIVAKEKGVALPSKEILKNCFENNSHGCGYMYADGECVHIRKGFMTFADFEKDFDKINNKFDLSNKAVVFHFRISTQAGVNKECTHPYPLSKNMKNLKKLYLKTNIGVAHNGIIDLTSSWGTKACDHNDTMEFITDYLSLIIKDNNFYQDKDTMTLIERLCGSKLAIMDETGHISYVGSFIHDKKTGMYYSNENYKKREYKTYTYSGYSKGMQSYAGGYYGYGHHYYDDDYDDYYDNRKTTNSCGSEFTKIDETKLNQFSGGAEDYQSITFNQKTYFFYEEEVELYDEDNGLFGVEAWDENGDDVYLSMIKQDGKYVVEYVC